MVLSTIFTICFIHLFPHVGAQSIFQLTYGVANASLFDNARTFSATNTVSAGENKIGGSTAASDAFVNPDSINTVYPPSSASRSFSGISVLDGIVTTDAYTTTAAIGESTQAGSSSISEATRTTSDSNGDIPESISSSFSGSTLFNGNPSVFSNTNAATVGESTNAASGSQSYAFGQGSATRAQSLSSLFGQKLLGPFPTEPIPFEPAPGVPSPSVVPCTSIYDTAAGVESLSALVAAVNAAGLTELLQDPSVVFTVLAPTNQAFSPFDLNEISTEELQQILFLHVIPSEALSSGDLLERSSVNTVQGGVLQVDSSSGGIAFVGPNNAARVVVPDIVACESVVHVIAAVLLP